MSKATEEKICVITLEAKNGIIPELQNVVDELIDFDGEIKEYGIKSNRCDLKYFSLDNNYSSDNERIIIRSFYQNGEVFAKKIGYEDFIKSSDKRIILNISYNPNIKNQEFDGSYGDLCDPTFFQYILLILQKIHYKKVKFIVGIHYKPDADKSITDSSYYSIRQSLYLYRHLMPDFVSSIYDYNGKELKRYYKAVNGNGSEQVSESKSSLKEYGRIFPFIPISENIYRVLVQENFDSKQIENQALPQNNDEAKKILQLKFISKTLDELIKYFLKNIKAETNKIITNKLRRDNYLSKLIFVYMLRYIHDSDKQEWEAILKNKVDIIYEICRDYAEGIHQLIENALLHVIQGPGKVEQGCGIFTLRIRAYEDESKYIDLESLKANNIEDLYKSVKYYMELYVTDLSYGKKEKGIVSKFIKNVKDRFKDKNSKLYQDISKAKISLAALFGKESNDNLNEYYANPKNIAFHYGLQIFANTVEVNNGYMFVCSCRDAFEDRKILTGNGEIYYYKSQISINDQNGGKQISFFDGNEKSRNINTEKNNNYFSWDNGTAYVIFIPIDYKGGISTADIPIVSIQNDSKPRRIKSKNLQLIGDFLISDEKIPRKEKIANAIYAKLQEIGFNSKQIYVLDVENAFRIIEERFKDQKIDQYNKYEILAKALFRCLADKDKKENPKDKKLNHLALINIEDRERVIQLLRQFMLFYRKGSNGMMENKSIFIIDKNAEIDIILSGNIEQIGQNMHMSQLTGGLDDRAMDIIRYFVKSRKQKGDNNV